MTAGDALRDGGALRGGGAGGGATKTAGGGRRGSTERRRVTTLMTLMMVMRLVVGREAGGRIAVDGAKPETYRPGIHAGLVQIGILVTKYPLQPSLRKVLAVHSYYCPPPPLNALAARHAARQAPKFDATSTSTKDTDGCPMSTTVSGNLKRYRSSGQGHGMLEVTCQAFYINQSAIYPLPLNSTWPTDPSCIFMASVWRCRRTLRC